MSPSARPGDRRADEGFALIASLLLVVVVTGVVIVLVSSALAELRDTGRQRDQEASIHAAEAAVDVVAERVGVSAAYATGHPWPFASTPTAAQERTWARAQLSAALSAATPPASLLTLPGPTCGATGACQPMRALGIRPSSAAGPLPVVYGVAAGPGADPSSARVIRVAITSSGHTPPHAILSGGNLLVDAELTVAGARGNVHTNGTLEVKKVSTATGDVTSVGTFTGPNLMTVPVGRTKAGGQPAAAVPVFTASTYYDRRFEVPAADWYDLCPDGRAHARSAGAPCTGAIVATPAGVRTGGGRWEFHQVTVTNGVYYVHQRDFTITGDTGRGLAVRPRVTVIASQATACGAGGSIDTDGDTFLEPYMGDGTLFIADREMRMRRKAVLGSAARPAFIGAAGTLRTDNEPSLTGAAIARHTCPGETSELRGKPVITYEGTLSLLGITSTAITLGAWDEL